METDPYLSEVETPAASYTIAELRHLTREALAKSKARHARERAMAQTEPPRKLHDFQPEAIEMARRLGWNGPGTLLNGVTWDYAVRSLTRLKFQAWRATQKRAPRPDVRLTAEQLLQPPAALAEWIAP